MPLGPFPKLFNLEQQIVLEAYDAESERLRMKVEQEKIQIKENVVSSSQNLLLFQKKQMQRSIN